MRTLSFVYIGKYRNLEDVGVGLNNRYVFEYDSVTNELTVDENKDYIPGFWGDGIQSFTAIMGNNGAGKTNLIRFIIENVIEGRNNDNPDGFLIWQIDDSWHCFPRDRKVVMKYKDGRKISLTLHNHNAELRTYFYTSHFLLSDDILSMQLSGLTNNADGHLLRYGVTEYLNKDEREQLDFHVYTRSFNAQSDMKMALFAAFFYRNLTERGIHVPRYVQLVPNTSSIIAHNLHCSKEERINYDTFRLLPGYEYKTKAVMMKLIYNSLVAYSMEKVGEIPKDLSNILTEEPEVVKDLGFEGVLDYVSEKYNRIPQAFIDRLKVVCRCVDFAFTQKEGFCFMDISKAESADALASFLRDGYQPAEFLTARHYDLRLSDVYNGVTYMSSGEVLLFNLFSRLFDAQFFKPEKFGNSEPCELIILDEAELGLHPEWQRNYIDMLVTILNEKMICRKPLQVIITSHSPIILSDIPKQNIVYLKKENGATKCVGSDQAETFASNVFDLYRNTFFLRKGMIGEYAQKKLNEISEALAEHRPLTPEQRKTVEQIGDVRIKRYITQQMVDEDRIYMLEAELAELKSKRRSDV